MVLCSVIAQKLHRIQIFRIVSTVLLTFFSKMQRVLIRADASLNVVKGIEVLCSTGRRI